MGSIKLMAPCHFGMEAVLKREVTDLGYEIDEVVDGRVTFIGDEDAIAKANINLRTTERVLVRVAGFEAKTFDELFESVKALEWERYIPRDGRFWVAKANSVSSQLFSPRDIQRIVKKAIVERLKQTYELDIFPEDGADYPLRISIVKDFVTIGLDTTGESLHKRGYRKYTAPAPLTETLASAILLLSPWKADRVLVDPFCGSGTIPIEAAMIARKIAPGMRRKFLAERWCEDEQGSTGRSGHFSVGDQLITSSFASGESFERIRKEAEEQVIKGGEPLQIAGYDIDDEVIRYARANAELAGVEADIHFQRRDVAEFSSPKKYGFVVTNPPYGERLSEKNEMKSLYRLISDRIADDPSWSWFILSGYEDAEKDIAKKVTKRRKIYNGMLKTYLYQYMGDKPPKRR